MSIFILIVFSFSMAFAQSKSAVILINSVPYNVVISSEGEIEEIKGEAKNHMRGYFKSKEEFDIKTDRSIVIESRVDADAGLSVRASRSFVSFQPGVVAITEVNENVINEALKTFSLESDDKILITAFKSSEEEGNKIADSRLSSMKAFLKAKGIPDQIIETEIVVSAALANQVSITYFK